MTTARSALLGAHSIRFAARLGAAGAIGIAALSGCALPRDGHMTEATQRWNEVRAGFKARLAEDQLAAGRTRGASEQINEARRLDPGNPALALFSARVALAEGRDHQARQILAQLRGEPSVAAEVAYLLGTIWQQQQDAERALDCYQQAAQLAPNEIAYTAAVAQTLLQLGRPQQALDLLSARRDAFGWTAAYHAGCAECLEQLGRFDDAATEWRTVCDGSRDARDVQLRLALALYHAGRMAEAGPLLEELARDADAFDSLKFRSLRLALADCLAAEGRTPEALTHLQPLMQEAPRDALVQRVKARIRAAAGDYQAAFALAHEALLAQPSDVGLLEFTAALAWRCGQHALADELATRLVKLPGGQDSPVAQAILAARRG